MHGQPFLAPHYLETSLSSIVQTPKRDRWAHLRFSIIGTLLAAPPAPGGLMASLQTLACYEADGNDFKKGVHYVCGFALAHAKLVKKHCAQIRLGEGSETNVIKA